MIVKVLPISGDFDVIMATFKSFNTSGISVLVTYAVGQRLSTARTLQTRLIVEVSAVLP